MSVFKTKWIILKKINSIDKKQQFLNIFSYDYWKIKTVKKISKSEKEVDIGNIINFEIKTKEKSDIHKISNIKIISSLDYQKYNYKIIELYLKLIWDIKNKSPEWTPIFEVFNIIDCINNLDNINSIKLILTTIKFENIIWELDIKNDDEIISKILKFIDNSKIDKIVKLTWINEEVERKLENLIFS